MGEIHGNPHPHIVLSRPQIDELMARVDTRSPAEKVLMSGVLGSYLPSGVDIFVDECPWQCTDGTQWPTCIMRKWEFEPFCETHQCGATDDVRCGKQLCPHCDGWVTPCSKCGLRCYGTCPQDRRVVTA